MRLVIQRVVRSSVSISGKVHASIGRGMTVLAGFEDHDTEEDILWACHKILNLRIFDNENGVMDLPVGEICGEILIISQFTLFASTRKGNRPSYIRAARPDISRPLYDRFIREISGLYCGHVKSGIFGSDMKVEILNDGPVTIIIDTKHRE